MVGEFLTFLLGIIEFLVKVLEWEAV